MYSYYEKISPQLMPANCWKEPLNSWSAWPALRNRRYSGHAYANASADEYERVAHR